MENKNNVMVVGLLAVIVGLVLGYFFGASSMPHRGWFRNESMYEEMREHMYSDEIINNDGAMMHAMDEMMLGFRGKSGADYEEAFLRGMIVHHVGAVQMAENLLEQTERPELRSLAENIIESQTAEIEMMRGWLDDWFNNDAN